MPCLSLSSTEITAQQTFYLLLFLTVNWCWQIFLVLHIQLSHFVPPLWQGVTSCCSRVSKGIRTDGLCCHQFLLNIFSCRQINVTIRVPPPCLTAVHEPLKAKPLLGSSSHAVIRITVLNTTETQKKKCQSITLHYMWWSRIRACVGDVHLCKGISNFKRKKKRQFSLGILIPGREKKQLV